MKQIYKIKMIFTNLLSKLLTKCMLILYVLGYFAYKGIKRFIGNVPLFSITAQPIAGFFPALA